ncbi:MAG: 3-methyl-2-oxobutanoate hydroxymethyltransferase [Lysobacteraceae bacterium]
MYAGEAAAPRKPVTVPMLRDFKREGRRITMLTAYDASFAAVMDEAGLDAVLVGDSLGNVVQGRKTTLSVTVDDMVYHCAAVSRGLTSALLIGDLPFQSYATPERALDSSHRLMAEGGAAMVKLEGAGPLLDCIEFLTQRDIPVCAHLGLTPQSVRKMGGYRVQGRGEAAAAKLRADARAVQEAGADLLVLECVPNAVAAAITADLDIPIIGIGAGADCDGQVLVMHDMLGVALGRRPRFVKNFLGEAGSIKGAIRAYIDAVRDGSFPDAEHSYES